jgi:hypothetical protein
MKKLAVLAAVAATLGTASIATASDPPAPASAASRAVPNEASPVGVVGGVVITGVGVTLAIAGVIGIGFGANPRSEAGTDAVPVGIGVLTLGGLVTAGGVALICSSTGGGSDDKDPHAASTPDKLPRPTWREASPLEAVMPKAHTMPVVRLSF